MELIIIGLEARVACLTVVIVATVAPLALVTAVSSKAGTAKTSACQLVTAHFLCALEVAVASC